MARCEDCKANKVCDHNKYGFENCGNYIANDVVPRAEYDAVVSAVDNSTKEFLKLHDKYQDIKRESENYKSIAETQQKLSMDRYFEIKQLKQELDEAKGEVERLEGELIVESTRRKNAVDAYHEARQKVAREIFEDLQGLLIMRIGVNQAIAELKNKYAEDESWQVK